MAKKRKTYTREFKIEAVRLLERSGRSQAEDELGTSSSSLSRCKKKCGEEDEDAFPGRGNLTPEEEHIRELEHENEILRQERDILLCSRICQAPRIGTHTGRPIGSFFSTL